MNILTLLEQNQKQYLSGEVIAKRLSMSRANVWKEISKLRKEGYEIIATPSKGYHLKNYNHNFSKYLLDKSLNDISIEIYKSLSSTNDFAKKSNQVNRLIIAQTQTNGRGRMGKSFYSPKNKGLYFSYVINPNLSLEMVPLITIAAALAIQKALPIKTNIKWLNDILIDDKKVAGILVEGDIELQTKSFNKIIVGVGINLFSSDVPQKLENIMTSVDHHTNNEIDKHKILIDFITEFKKRIIEIKTNKDKLISDYRAECITINKDIIYENKVYKVININEFGQLIVKDKNNNQIIIQAGEIHDHN